MSQNKGKVHYAWLMLICLCLMVGLGRGGLNNSGGLYLTPVSEDLGIGIGSLSVYMSIASIATMVFLPIAGKILTKYDVRLVLVGAVILQAGSFSMFGFMNSVWGWYIFAVPMSIGAIFITQVSGPVLLNQWFKKRTGFAIGVMMAASGAIGAIIQPIIGSLIENQGWRFAYTSIGVVVIAISVPIIIFFIRKPQDKNMLPYGQAEVTQDDNQETKEPEVSGVELAVARKSMALYALILFFFLITSFGSFAMHIPSYAMSMGHDVKFAGNVMSAFMIGMLVGSLTFGYLSDKIGAKSTALFAMVVGFTSVSLLLFLAEMNIMLMLGVGLFGFVSASIGTLGPVLTSTLFGNRDYTQIFSTASLGLAVAGILALPIYGYIYQFTGTYSSALYAILVMLVIATFIIFVAFKGKQKLIDEGKWV
ncbi:MFS transporter [Lentibacillus saliphilus]|uniref:MFS transporter n=1 Tax=Lentibacillus saliphilus TaxID=2737028 RepID=UPI001C3041F7|nr:MFS transporter [Lentibacillus saliphilus]